MFSFDKIDFYWKLKDKYPDLERNIYRVLSMANAKSISTAITDVDLYAKYKELIGSPLPLSIYPKNNYSFHDFTYSMGGLNSNEMDETPAQPKTSEEPVDNEQKAEAAPEDDKLRSRGFKYYLISDEYYLTA